MNRKDGGSATCLPSTQSNFSNYTVSSAPNSLPQEPRSVQTGAGALTAKLRAMGAGHICSKDKLQH